ncbi:MAG: DUF1802 family protein [Verrucomicrobiae bacterium]|nr:DUF1802 family protein [Verrucomicrobiae bacterium]
MPHATHPPQTPSMRVAFKEWAVIVEALGRGRQSLILRKGGIAEDAGVFRVDHPRFLLFPTQFHQHRDHVLPDAADLADAAATQAPPPDQLRIRYAAAVVGWRLLASLGEVQALAGHHLWSPETIANRFTWGGEESIVLMALRVFRLEPPAELPMQPDYGGCRSWVTLEQDIDTAGALPVLDEAAHARWIASLQDALGSPLHFLA